MIACVYCGGGHERPAEVKRCWAEHEGDAPTDDEPPRPRQQAGPAPQRERPAVPVRVDRGPAELGRNMIVGPGASPPPGWSDCAAIEIGADQLAEPASVLDEVRRAAHERRSVVFVLDDDVDLGAVPTETDDREPFRVGAGQRFVRDELVELVRANAFDLRGDARWHVVDLAVALGAAVVEHGPGDVRLPDGRVVWLDGGPVGYRPPIEGVDVLPSLHLEHGSLSTQRSNRTGAELAPDQLAAVTHAGGSARIIAPAGSGKTRVLTERARHLLTEWNVPSSALTLVAFNKRAQEEMGGRTGDLPGLHVRTLNAIGLAIVNGTPPFAPQRRSWRTIDEPDVRRILGGLVQRPRKLNVDPMAAWIDALSLVRLGLVDPAEAEARYGGDVDGLAEVWPRFRAALDRAGAVDFDDQIYRAIEVLLTQPEARAAAQRSCRHLLVDEFQDLTPAHLLLVRLLGAPGAAVFGVGDDDQTIYGYNGADPAWLIDFERWFPGAGDHPLEVNYRCPAGVVDVADRLLRHNRRRVDKVIRAASTDDGGWSATNGDDSVALTLAAVQGAVERGATPGEIAVLSRVNVLLAPVQAALVSAGVPVSGGVGGDFLDRPAVRAALAWLRIASGAGFVPADLGEAVRRPSRGLSPRLREWVAEQRDLAGLERLAGRLTNDRDAAKVNELAVDVARLAGMVRRGATTAELIEVLVDDIGLGGAVATLDAGRRGTNRSAQGDDLSALRQLARQHAAVTSFERWLRDRLMARRSPDGVVLSTVHRVKGQEWPHVVVHQVDDDQFPHRLAEDREEERRLLHVAITRCRVSAVIVSGEHPSPFVAELTSEPPQHPVDPPPPAPARSRPAEQRRAAPDHPLLDRQTVMAVPGVVLVDQGQEWTIEELEPQAAVARHGDAIRRFPIGAKVETAGRQRGRLGPRSGDVDEATARAFDLLRAFRDRVRGDKPAFTVFDDKTLVGIATALPVDLAELGDVKGIGPAKLEQYGDDVLALVADALGDA